jgi:hypothetical protein
VEQELISKKELLSTYGISYGALYRWKRKGLIPEDWFIKKSTATGQETFFPRQLICERVALIKKQKEDVSLEALSKLLSCESGNNATLILETVFGQKVFRFSDIRSITVHTEDGTSKDITNDIIGGNG